MAIADSTPQQTLWQKIMGWLAPPHVRETAKVLKEAKAKEQKAKKEPLKAPPSIAPVTTAVATKKSLPLVFLDHGEMGPAIPRAHEYANSKARERELSGYAYKENFVEDTLLVKFAEGPTDTILIKDPEYGGHCHPKLGVTYKVAKAQPNMDWKAV